MERVRAKSASVSHHIASTAKEYCERTSIHGFSYCITEGRGVYIISYNKIILILCSGKICHRVGWILVVLLAFFGASLFLNEAIGDWMQNPTGYRAIMYGEPLKNASQVGEIW